MTPEMLQVLGLLLVAVFLFVTDLVRVDLAALLVLLGLALTGLVSPEEALSGFGNPTVVTIWTMFILSGGLSRTGVADVIGRRILSSAGDGEIRLVVLIMLTAGVLSAFMNNVAVAAFLLPVVMDIGRRTGRSPSRLMIPLAFGGLLGGATTLIGTHTNIVLSNALTAVGISPFGLFDFMPVGLIVMLSGTAYMVLLGRHLLPSRGRDRPTARVGQDLKELFRLEERMFVLTLRKDSPLVAGTLAGSRLGLALGLNVLAVVREGKTLLAPDPQTRLLPGDRLVVEGKPERFAAWHREEGPAGEGKDLDIRSLVSTGIELAEARLGENSPLAGKTLQEADLRRQFGLNVIELTREGVPLTGDRGSTPLEPGDVLLIQGDPSRMERLGLEQDLSVSRIGGAGVYELHDRLLAVAVPSGSYLEGKTVSESRLGEAYNVTLLGITREGRTILMPQPDQPLEAGDTLLLEGRVEDLATLKGLQSLEFERTAPEYLKDLESEQVGLMEVVLSPHTTLSGRTLREINFRERYGLSVLAIWRNGEVHRSHLRDMELRFGDALLLHGPRERLSILGEEQDFVVLTGEAPRFPRSSRAPLSLGIMLAVLLAVSVAGAPVYLAALAGAAAMVLAGCLTMDEAYRSIEWRAVLLIAGLLPMGIALERSGVGALMAEAGVETLGGFGPRGVLAGFFILTALASQVMPTAAVAVLISPLVLNTAEVLGLSPKALLMGVAVSAAGSFMSPVGHPASALVMGPGGYRFTDFAKVGLPLTLVTFLIVLLILPLFWPLNP